MKGKAIYTPQGKAAEYARYACNFYVGCSNRCEYCCCKKGILAGVMGQDKPRLKKCFKNEYHAVKVLEREIEKNVTELRKHGLFFSFTTDPMLPDMRLVDGGRHITIDALASCCYRGVPVKILTKRADILHHFIMSEPYVEWRLLEFVIEEYKPLIAIGFTLTGHDELEPGASTNTERIAAMKRLHDAGFKTFASIEPIIDFSSSYDMICKTMGFCDLYMVGLMAGKKYDVVDAQTFVERLSAISEMPKIYLKESLQKLTHYTNEELDSNFVDRDYNIFQ